MRPSKSALLLGIVATVFAGARSFTKTVAENTFGASAPAPALTPKIDSPALMVENLLLLHAPKRPPLLHAGFARHGLRRLLCAKRRKFFKEFDRFGGVPSRNGHDDGHCALLNRAARRAIAQRLQFAA